MKSYGLTPLIGELLRATGPMAKANPFRFSTKFQDDETDLLYYGYRYLNTLTGRWLSRDPAGRRGGANLYGFVGNAPLTACDALGLFSETHSMAGHGTISVTIIPEKSDQGWKHQRTIDSSITWTPPADGKWNNVCNCKPCTRAEWRQERALGSNYGSGTWQDDNYDPSSGLNVIHGTATLSLAPTSRIIFLLLTPKQPRATIQGYTPTAQPGSCTQGGVITCTCARKLSALLEPTRERCTGASSGAGTGTTTIHRSCIPR